MTIPTGLEHKTQTEFVISCPNLLCKDSLAERMALASIGQILGFISDWFTIALKMTSIINIFKILPV